MLRDHARRVAVSSCLAVSLVLLLLLLLSLVAAVSCVL
jgi:hypothetical protein